MDDTQDDHEKTRAQRRSEAWKAEQAELERAIAADAADARKAREARQAYSRKDLAQGYAPRLLFATLLGALVLLLAERELLDERLMRCLNPQLQHNYGCVDIIAKSFWVWLLPSDDLDQLHAAQEAFHR